MQQGTKKQTVFALEVEDKIIIGLKKKNPDTISEELHGHLRGGFRMET